MSATAIAVKERPILFTAENVRAIRERRKTKTRRVINLPLKDKDFGCEVHPSELTQPEQIWRLCPLGAPGDRLWVRETWCYWGAISEPLNTSAIAYRADADQSGVRWRPAIFMPRWASRITLEITDVRVERLQEISEEDAQAEGLEYPCTLDITRNGDCPVVDISRPWACGFARLWNSINGKKHPWRSDPWVWVLSFELLTGGTT